MNIDKTFYQTLKQIANSVDPSEELKRNIANTSLKDWLETGHQQALLDGIVYDRGELSKQCLIVIDAIIPPIPPSVVNKVHTNILVSQFNDLTEIMPKVTDSLCYMIRSNSNGQVALNVLCKFLYYANEQTLENDHISDTLINFTIAQLIPCCHDYTHSAIEVLEILFGKMSDVWLLKFMESHVFVAIKMMNKQTNKCSYEDHLRKLCCDWNIEERIRMEYPFYGKLQDICSTFDEQCLITTLKCASHIISEIEEPVHLFFLSGILHKFQTLLCRPSEIGDEAFVIKSFLTVFLCFDDDDTEKNYIPKSDLYEKFVRLVVELINTFVVFSRDMKIIYKENDNDNLLSLIKHLENDTTELVKLLQSLYVLNRTWHQWFDIAVDNKIIEDNLFECWPLGSPDEGVEDLPHVISLIRLCPATVSVETKREMFIPSNTNNIGEFKCFEISRSNVMNDVFEIFQKNGDLVLYHWDFTFKNEIARGPGVTSEVYSMLSNDLQNRCTGVRPGGQINELTHTCEADSASIDDRKHFELLGKIVAKVILDERYLDDSLSIKFFDWLGIPQFKSHTHLIRSHFELLRIFPMLESLFKQILPVKRKIETIRSEAGLSQRQKHDIISNLTFDNGSSFDDLCLNFTIPGTDNELFEGGRDVLLSPHNIDLYFEKLCDRKVQFDSSIQYDDIRNGFNEVLPDLTIDFFCPEDLKQLCFGEFKRWTEEDLKIYCTYNLLPSVRFLFQCLASFDVDKQKLFLKFVTGRTSLPSGGLTELNPRLKIIRMNCDHADSYLPESLTCSHTLILPDYSNINITKQKLLYVIEEGNNSFSFV